MISEDDRNPIIDIVAFNLAYGGSFNPEELARVIEAHGLVIPDVAEEIGGPDLRARYAGKLAGLPDAMSSIIELDKEYPGIASYIAQRVMEHLGLEIL
jgi:hypothetical protein